MRSFLDPKGAPQLELAVLGSGNFIGEGGLLGATVDLDSDYKLIITPPEQK